MRGRRGGDSYSRFKLSWGNSVWGEGEYMYRPDLWEKWVETRDILDSYFSSRSREHRM